MKHFLAIFLLLILGAVNAQPEGAPVETINGKKYYVHIVEQGNTLYGIQTLYKTKLETILSANPGLSDNLAIGQRILIPVPLDNTTHYGTHVVLQGETLYGISKKYGCTVDELKTLNPGVENGLSIGQKLQIPIASQVQPSETIQSDPVRNDYQISYTDSIVKHTVLEHETLYSISKRYMVTSDTIQKLNNLEGVKVKKGDVLLIPVKKVNYQILDKQIPDQTTSNTTNSGTSQSGQIVRKSVYRVALILPFMLSQNEAEMAKPLKVDQVRELLPNTKMSFEFYQGFVFAADSLQQAGLSVDIYVYDTKKDSATIVEIFKKPEFADMDLVVGPMFQNEINIAAILAEEKQIPIVLPFKTDAAVLYQNPMVYKTVSSNMTLFDGAVDYALQYHNKHNVLLVKPTSTADLAIFERCKERYNTGISKYPAAMNNQILEVSPGSSSGRDLETYIKMDTVNIVIVPSENIKFVAGIMHRLNSILNSNYRSSKLRIIVFGIEDWNKYEDLDVMQKNKLYQHYATYRFVDFNKDRGLQFVRGFRKRYGTDPGVFAAQGFDIGLYFLGALHLYGENFNPHLANFQVDLIQNRFQFAPVAEGSGYENKRVTVVMYNGYELVQLTK